MKARDFLLFYLFTNEPLMPLNDMLDNFASDRLVTENTRYLG
jgi:hypothetical protein